MAAKRSDVERIALRQAGALIAIGIAAGLIGAIFFGQVLAKLLFGVRPRNPLTLAFASLSVAAIALVAVFVPARRAANMDPLVALRFE